MNDEASAAPPKVFYWISGVALVWNLFGIMAYLGQVTMSPEVLAEMPAERRALFENVPAWATAAYAIAVNAGALGCLLLLIRKSLAIPLLAVSLAAVLVQMFHAFFMTNSIEVLGGSSVVFPLVIILIGAYLVWFAMDAKKKGWIS